MDANATERSLKSLEPAAGNGLLDRRAFLRGGAALAAAMTGYSAQPAAAAPLAEDPWSQAPGGNVPAYGVPSRFEKGVARTLSNPNAEPRTQHARTPHHLLQGSLTPNGLHFVISHSGDPDVDPAAHRLVIHGLVRQHGREVAAPPEAHRGAGHDLLRVAHLRADPARRQSLPVLLPAGSEIVHRPSVARPRAERPGLLRDLGHRVFGQRQDLESDGVGRRRRELGAGGAAGAGALQGVHALSRPLELERRSGGAAEPRLGRGGQRAADARPDRRCPRRDLEAAAGPRVSEPALQRPDELGGRRFRRSQACIRLGLSSFYFYWKRLQRSAPEPISAGP